MEISCSVVKDLLPLYFEGMVSEETKTTIDEHLSECESCAKELGQMKRMDIIIPSADHAPLKKIKTELQRQRATAVAFAMVLTLLFALLGVGYMLAPQAVPYDSEMFSFTMSKSDELSVCIHRPVASWDLEYVSSEELGGKVCFLSAWTNNAIKWWGADVPSKNEIVKEKGEALAGVYYTPNDGGEDILLYGTVAPENGGSITLPRLALAYYALTAVIAALLMGLVVFFNRKNKRLQYMLLKIEYFPCAYLIAHFLVKGFDARTYVIMYDLCSILLIAMPVYGLCLLAECLLRKNHLPWDKL